MATQDVLEMAYPKRYVEHIITGLEDPLNQHLVKLVGLDFAPVLREHFREECETWLDKNSASADETEQPDRTCKILLRSAV